MADHRIRLTDQDVALIVAALKARRAMTESVRQHHVDRLIARLSEGTRGNPRWIIDEEGQLWENEWMQGFGESNDS